MQVEVNEQNIILYGLVQLTGNSAEKMLQLRDEAAKEGLTLFCKVPDIADDLVEMNVFETAGSEPADERLTHGGGDPFGEDKISLFDGSGRVIDVSVESLEEEADVATDESDETEEDQHG